MKKEIVTKDEQARSAARYVGGTLGEFAELPEVLAKLGHYVDRRGGQVVEDRVGSRCGPGAGERCDQISA